jgi:hypothetical protein
MNHYLKLILFQSSAFIDMLYTYSSLYIGIVSQISVFELCTHPTTLPVDTIDRYTDLGKYTGFSRPDVTTQPKNILGKLINELCMNNLVPRAFYFHGWMHGQRN